MYVRDHQRPEMHKAMGLDPATYDFEVFRITSEITKQVFPLTINLEDPRFRAGLERLRRISEANEAARAQGGVVGGLKRAWYAGAAALAFGRLLLLPVVPNTLPANARLAPTW
jgi:magnesium-protoporphyrin IX monomethyl ester (oxidative) cyclase